MRRGRRLRGYRIGGDFTRAPGMGEGSVRVAGPLIHEWASSVRARGTNCAKQPDCVPQTALEAVTANLMGLRRWFYRERGNLST